MLKVGQLARSLIHAHQTSGVSAASLLLSPRCRSHYSTTKYDEVYRKSLEHPEEFWAEISQCVHWFKPWSKVLDLSNSPAQKW